MREYDEERGLYFEVGSDGAFVTDSESRINEVIIPEEYKGKPVLAILKKAFLGRKQLRRVTIPGSVKSIGQWAFSSCDALRSVRLKRTECIFERGVFKGDKRLESIYIEGESKEIARLLAASVVMEADYLLEPMTAGSSEWLDKWDGKLSSILDQA
ncbi:MAG: leucine-rich repeat domain-containing protein, partial [Lachnospiraceae bacterium]|nr:leucine-rich repeat domain-containing protein [Lachnospiraceae bacterium]